MKKILSIAISAMLLQQGMLYAKEYDTIPMLFVQNKGQVTDQFGKRRADIDFKTTGAAGVTMFVGQAQLHYQWQQAANSKNKKEAAATKIYRMDVALLGADTHATVIAEDIQSYVENYYNPQYPEGIQVTSFKKITYKNVYPQIDWVLYTTGNGKEPAQLKHEFVVHKGGNARQIRLQYSGATALTVDDGALVATTPFGSITEAAPYTYYTSSKEPIASAYTLQGNIVSYATGTATDDIVIDPTLVWATYYGGSENETGGVVATDTAGNAYITGSTVSTNNIATSGAFQTSYVPTIPTGGAEGDGFIVKFNSSGVRQWATYYGGNSFDALDNAIADSFGNLYVCGRITSTGLATSGAYMTSPSSVGTGMIIKLNAATGSRTWASYYPVPLEITCDGTGNVFVASGQTAILPTGLATSGAFQTTAATGLVSKFSNAGALQWATYFNGEIYSLKFDRANNLYVAGRTYDNTGVATTGAHKTTFTATSGNSQAFLAKFTSGGSRIWGTYYGGNTLDVFNDVDLDSNCNIYVAGITASSSGVATAGSHLSTIPGTGAGMLVKFDSSGKRKWGTYFGSAAGVPTTGVVCDPKGNVYITGAAVGSSGVATPGAYQTTNGGNIDIYLAVFSSNGTQRYGTYYGGPNDDNATFGSGNFKEIAYSKNKVYLCSQTSSTSGISTAGAHQYVFGGKNSSLGGSIGDAFLVQFEIDTMVWIQEPFQDTALCSGQVMHIPYRVNKNFRSTNTFTIQLSDATGSFSSPTTLTTISGNTGGTYNWTVPSTITTGSSYRVRITATAPIDTAYEEANIRLTPTPVVTAGSNAPLCSGNNLLLSAASTVSGVTWSWTGPSFSSAVSSPVITAAQPSASGDYYVTASINGCIGKDTVTVLVNQAPVVSNIGSNSPICENSDLLLHVIAGAPGITWSWTGPGGFTDNVQNPTRPSAGLGASGVYDLTAYVGACSTTVSTTVSVVSGPTALIYPSPNDSICVGGTLTMVALVTNAGTSPQYQWLKNNAVVTGATGLTYIPATVANNDTFSFRFTPGAGAACATVVNSTKIPITVLPPLAPKVTMTATDTNAWPGLQVDFIALATDAGKNPKYQWKLNGANVQGATSDKWGAANLNNGDEVCVEVTSDYMCPQPAIVTACKKVKIATGIAAIADDGIDIYPNPASDVLNVKNIPVNTTVQLYDLTGREVYNVNSVTQYTQIPVKQLIPQAYMLHLTFINGSRIVKKVTITR